MTPEEKEAYEWALKQNFPAVASRYAKVLAKYIERHMKAEYSIVGKKFFVESVNFEGIADVLGVNDDDTVHIRSENTGAIYIVDKADLSDDLTEGLL